nr:MAG TPA: hypothetical protein [Caudoviricetes sp.]
MRYTFFMFSTYKKFFYSISVLIFFDNNINILSVFSSILSNNSASIIIRVLY